MFTENKVKTLWGEGVQQKDTNNIARAKGEKYRLNLQIQKNSNRKIQIVFFICSYKAMLTLNVFSVCRLKIAASAEHHTT